MAACTKTECPYHGERIEVPFSGTDKVDVLIVGESPGSMEESLRKPFVGKSGDILNALLESIGMDRNMVFIANSCRCRIDKDNDSIKTVNDALRTCRPNLEKAIRIIKPKVIVALGAVALKQLTGKQQILQNRGRVFESEWGIPVVCTVHPAYVLRGAQRGFPDIPRERMQQKERMIFEDFELVKNVLAKKGSVAAGEIDTSKYTEGTAKDWSTFNKAKYVALDFETSGLDVFDPTFKILSFAVSCEEGVSKAFVVKNNKLPAGFIKILENPKITKVVAYRNFEEKVLRKICNVEMKGQVHDVLVMAHLIDENGSGYSLQNLAGIYTPLRHIKDLIGGEKGRFERIANADKDTLLKYNSVDADATLRLFHVLKDKMRDDPELLRYYMKFTVPVQNMLSEVYMNGCLIDKKALKEGEAFLSEESLKARTECIRLMPPQIKELHSGNLELSRRALIIDTLFSRKGFKLHPMTEFLTPKTKEPKVGKEHLQNFMDEDTDHGKFIKAYLTWTSVNKFKSTYLEPMWEEIRADGRVYPETIVNRTVTGRTVMADPPIQVFPARGSMAKQIKKIFTAGRGWSFIGRDLGQSEMRIAGWLANDPVILDTLRKNIDIHIKTASMIKRITIEQFKTLPKEEQKSLRQKAKAVNFGLIFGMGANKLQIYAKQNYGVDMTLEECEQVRNMYFKEYARLLVYHAQQRHLVHKQGFVRSPLGRKRNLPEVYSNEYSFRGGAERQAINQPVQGFSTDLGMLGMMLFHIAVQKSPELRDKVKVLFFIHDAIYAITHNSVKKKAMALLKECMEDRAPAYIEQNFGIKVGYPVASDGSIGPNWGEMSDYADQAHTTRSKKST